MKAYYQELQMTTTTSRNTTEAVTREAEIVREYGPVPAQIGAHGVTNAGQLGWSATGDALSALAPASGTPARTLQHPCDAGTAFDGTYLYQIAEHRIDKIDPTSGKVVASIPAPGN